MNKAMGFIGAAERLANLLAYAVGGLLVVNLTQERFVLAIVVTACAVAVGCLVSLTLREPPIKVRKEDRDSSLELLADGIRTLKSNGQFRGLVLLALATVPFRNYLGLYQPRFVEVGVPPIWLGLAQALGAGICVLGARYAYWLEERLGSRWSLLLVTGLPGVLYLLMAVVIHPVFTVVVFCALYGSMSLKGPIFSGHLNRHIESKNRATVLSLISMFSGLYVALMGLVIGRIGDLAVTYAFVFMGAVILVGSLLFRVKNTDSQD